jgi:hypothetical protein
VQRIPLWLKIAYTAFMIYWVPTYAGFNGAQNFLWLCDLCNFILLVALWTESRLLISSQLVAVMIIDAVWMIDVGVAWLTGWHPLGGTEYMFDPSMPAHIRALSLFHVFVPLILIWGVIRLGYDRRGPLLQTLVIWITLPLTFLLTTPDRNLNWVWGFGGRPPSLLHPWLYLALCMVLYPVVLLLPVHGLALLLGRRRSAGRRAVAP